MKVGDRVRVSLYSRRGMVYTRFGPRHFLDRCGTVVRIGKHTGGVHVLWDGRATTEECAPSELVPAASGDPILDELEAMWALPSRSFA